MLASFVALAVVLSAAAVASSELPNIVVLVVDDADLTLGSTEVCAGEQANGFCVQRRRLLIFTASSLTCYSPLPTTS